MPPSGNLPLQSADADMLLRAIKAAQTAMARIVFEKQMTNLTEGIKQRGFTATLKSLKRSSTMMTVFDGVVEKLPSGTYAAALQTDKGRLVIRGAEHADYESTDPQFVSSDPTPSYDVSTDSKELTADQLLHQLADAGSDLPCSLLCEIELLHFNPSQREVLLPLLWQYILDHRNSNDRGTLAAVGAAMRKYIAIMPMDRIAELVVLLESGNRSPLPIDIEVEVVKMIYRNFEVNPPVVADSQTELAQRLWEIVQAYINPRILLRGKHAAVASLAIEAMVSMRSSLAVYAWQAACACPYRWFAELVCDDLDELHESWNCRNAEAAAWLRKLRKEVVTCV